MRNWKLKRESKMFGTYKYQNNTLHYNSTENWSTPRICTLNVSKISNNCNSMPNVLNAKWYTNSSLFLECGRGSGDKRLR